MTYSNSPLAELTYGPAPAAKSEEQLIESHLPLVRKLAWHVHSRMSSAIEVEDLLQTGMVALVEAAQSYQDRGLGFTNYAKLRVRGAMIDALRKASHVSRSAMTFQKRLRAAEDELSRQLGRSPAKASWRRRWAWTGRAFAPRRTRRARWIWNQWRRSIRTRISGSPTPRKGRITGLNGFNSVTGSPPRSMPCRRAKR